VFFTNTIDFSWTTTMQPKNTKIKINLKELLDGQRLIVFCVFCIANPFNVHNIADFPRLPCYKGKNQNDNQPVCRP